ncbi:FliH/SctL family protein [Thermomicrobiaceae bacterium CFH 74404]|uniref:Flagellar assembly protein FliH n=1 Tax=Thermalbibacter longus TaxID=2951981 RepID=A0AA41WB45_9BACT|nr:FliH/SctL family protein [Thermalbibacter longus]MCM8749719.1 FliH/SctL family protein [Thermalbibacter longus]
MASRSVLKHWTPTGQGYAVEPQPSRHDRERAVRLLSEAREAADQLLAQARAEAQAILEAAEREREAAWEAMRQAALAEARREAQQQMAEEMERTFGRFRSLVERAIVREDELRRACYQELVRLAVKIAEVVIRREVRQDPEFLARLAAAALAQAPAGPISQILVHPDDLETMQRWLTYVWDGDQPALELATDPHVDRGSCVIGTPTGFIDARISTQLVEIERALLEVAEHA